MLWLAQIFRGYKFFFSQRFLDRIKEKKQAADHRDYIYLLAGYTKLTLEMVLHQMLIMLSKIQPLLCN